MVKYTCKTPTARVNETTAVREALPKRMPGVACTGRSSGSRLTPRSCSMGFNSPFMFIAGSNPAVRCKTYRRWIGLSLGTQKGMRKLPFVCKHHQSSMSWARAGQYRFPVGATQKRPCPRADTVSPRSAPKAPFPCRDGDTQAPGRRFCGHDGETHTTLQEDHIS